MLDIEIPHPSGDGTRVIFYSPTSRQEEVLQAYLELVQSVEEEAIDIDPADYPNDTEFGAAMRKLLTQEDD